MTRSLRRVLLPLVLVPLVLLSGLALRSISFDAGSAPALVPLLPAPPRLALPWAAGPPGEDGPAPSTEVVAAAAPKKKKPREFLILPRTRRWVPSSAVNRYSDSDALTRSVIRINNNGTVQLVDRLSNSPLWEVCTGPLPSEEITTSDPDMKYIIYPLSGDSSELFEFYNGTSVILPWKLDDFVARTPFIRDSFVTIGSKVSTIFIIDGCSGKVLYKYCIPSILNELDGPGVDGMPSKSTAGTNDRCGSTVMFVRTDYSLSASDLGEHLFNWTRTFFTAKYRIHNHRNMLGQPSHVLGEIPCIRTEGAQVALPDSSLANATAMRDVKPIAPREDDDALKPHQTSWKSPQADGESHIFLDDTQNQTYDPAVFVSADSEVASKFTKKGYAWLFPVLPVLLVIGYVLSFLTSAICSCKQFVIGLIRGRSEGTQNKRRRKRKRGKHANRHEILSESDKGNGETGGPADTQAKKTSLSTNTGNDEDDGRQIRELYISKKEIGRGSNGTVVFEGSSAGRQVAVKRLLSSHHDIATKEIENLMLSDRDPNIVRLYGWLHDNDFVYIALERCNCSLADLIQKHSDSEVTVRMKSKISNAEGIDVQLWTQDGLPSAQLLKLIRDVVSGLTHLHSLGIVHRDLKPQNVLINTEGAIIAKLSDMGISKRLPDDITSMSHHGTGLGSAGWQAPEQIRHGHQTRAMDIFSLGCLIFYCISKGKHPFGDDEFDRDRRILRNRFNLSVLKCIPEAVHLLTQLLKPKPEQRPSAVYVMQHPLFWSAELSLSFLKDTSDRIEKLSNEADLIKALNSIKSKVFGKKWKNKLDPILITDINIGKYRRYNTKSVRDLLRYIRNKSSHYRELPDDHKTIFGSLPEEFYRYFARRFPKLLIQVYKVMGVHCKEEAAFSKYFK